MTLEPLLNATPAVQFHVLTVVPAALIGGAMLLANKGTYIHRMGGRVWIALMMLTALSTFFIHEINMFHGFSPIHLLSLVVLVASVGVIRSARQRNFAKHKRIVKMLYFGGIGIAGLFTLLPGRIMHDVVFSSATAQPAQTAVPLSVQVAAGAPVWVWPLLLALVALGVSRMRDRDMPLWRLLLLPVILTGVSLTTTMSAQMTGSTLAAAIAGASAGLFAGLWSMRAVPVVMLPGNRVRVKGEFISLFAILGIFASRFAAGTLAAIAPEIIRMQGVTELFALLPVFCAALMAARALAQAGYNPLGAADERLTAEA